MKYTVRWTRKARLQQLAQVWLDAPERNAVTAAANEVDRLLATDPAGQGESRAGGLRVLIVEPLLVGYRCGVSQPRPRVRFCKPGQRSAKFEWPYIAGRKPRLRRVLLGRRSHSESLV